ncbi:glycosyltransferase family A protein [Sporosarcina aquimarina]|uniref:4,4'-diaponeurosporenoate glycosyltransferase n=1 Tax=Sporosarcina aquimarina TaxID=114975 RepID=A0ABU4G2S0_9BACL|nr:glycosyltransferase family 2 protein [Sporosarcina aquimarina]MDW0111267.1 glycosyltransferase family 2 protein [Sporosarcina aquimarina]
MMVTESINPLIVCIALVAGHLMFWQLPVPKTLKRRTFQLPLVSIIIPARNEANRIEPLLRSLQRQNLKNFELIVVDDDSSDDTAAIAADYGAHVITVSPGSSGSGKSLACWRGAEQSTGQWLLFLDADTYLSNEDSLEKLLVLYHQKGATGILSLQPFHTVHRLYENLSAVFNIIVIVGMNIFTVKKDAFKTAGSFGPCIMCDRSEYFSTGGHEKIQSALMDDLALGKEFLDHDFAVNCMGGKGTLSFRMYPEGFKSMVDGWCKSFAIGSKSTHPVVMLLVIIWITGSFISVSELISSLSGTAVLPKVLSIGLYVLFAIQTGRLAKRCGNFKWPIFIFYPVLFLFFTGIFLYSLFRVYILRSVNWKDRKIDV